MAPPFARPGCCLGCGAVIGASEVCPHCGLAQQGVLADRLRGLLEEADLALDRLRRESPRPEPKSERESMTAASWAWQADHSPSPDLSVDIPAAEGQRERWLPPAYPAPAPAPVARRPRRLPAMSTPVILLSLGAISILVAAIVFVTVNWSDLSLAWKAAILLMITAGFGGLAVWSARKPLRASAETFGTLVVLFVGIDLLAARAGGLAAVDAMSWSEVLWTTAIAVVVVGAGLAWWARRTPVTSLVGPQVVAGVGSLGLVVLTFASSDWWIEYTAFLVLVGAAILGWLALRIGLFAMGVVLGVLGAGVALLALAISLLRVLGAESAADLWADGAGVGWLICCLGLVGGALVERLPGVVRTVLAGLAWMGFTLIVLRPVFGTGPNDHPDALVLAVAAAALVHGLSARFVAAPWGAGARWAGWAPTLVGALLLAPALEFLGETVRPTEDQLWAIPVDAVVQASSLSAAPWAIGLSSAALFAAGWLLATRQQWPRLLDAGLVLTCLAAASIVLSGVPLWLLVVLVALPAVLAVVTGAVLERLDLVVAGAIVFAAALTAASMSPWTTAGVALAGALCSALVAWRMQRIEAVTVAACLVPPLVALLGASVVELLDQDTVVSGVALVAVALVAWLLAQTGRVRDQQPTRIGTEVGAACVFVVGLVLTSDDPTILAVTMTISGVVVVGTGLVRADRRWASWPGGVLLAGATWVRLYDADVSVVEAYTLPSALVLVGLAGWRMIAVPTSSSMLLAPGLALGLLPSLVLALEAPTSLRALLLGLGALAVMLAGAVLRWAVPLLAGGAVVALLVLVNLGPQALAIPRWTIFAAGGALLLFLGLTWEQRLGELRRIGAAVAHLR